MNANKKLIRNWGENTAYSAKTHFKMYDFNKYWIYSLILINLLFAVFSLLDFGDKYSFAAKIFSITSLIASILILVHESQTNSKDSRSHRELGEQYLALHYDLERLYSKTRITSAEVDDMKSRITSLNTTDKPSVNFIAKKWATWAIERKEEMHTWWK